VGFYLSSGDSDLTISTDIHYLWDYVIPDKAIRETSSKYNLPLPDPKLESHLQGKSYDPFIRKIVWEGISNKWADEVEYWADCPTPKATQSWGETKQWLMGLLNDEKPLDNEFACPYYWSKPTHQMLCDFVWPKDVGLSTGPYVELNTPQYGGMIADGWVLEKQLATGGIRLASILNGLFTRS
jgi:hypothetical protein